MPRFLLNHVHVLLHPVHVLWKQTNVFIYRHTVHTEKPRKQTLYQMVFWALGHFLFWVKAILICLKITFYKWNNKEKYFFLSLARLLVTVSAVWQGRTANEQLRLLAMWTVVFFFFVSRKSPSGDQLSVNISLKSKQSDTCSLHTETETQAQTNK